MKVKYFFKIISFTFIMFFLFFFTNKVEANSINSINMDIFIDNDGTAIIKEIWDCTTSQGTEVYHPYYNLGSSTITNLTVKDNNTLYTTINNWNTNGTLESKKYKCGLNSISDGIEICWGISSYGKHKYEVSYKITNFVSELNDSQMVYWTLIPNNLSNTVGNVYIKIYSDFDFASDTDVWGYGKYGAPCYVYDGYIEMTSDGTLYSDEYMTLLAKFPLGTFSLSNKINEDFEYYIDMADEGSTKYTSSSNSTSSLPFIIPMILPILFIFFISISIIARSAYSTELDFGATRQ